jgi:hypothetical protein
MGVLIFALIFGKYAAAMIHPLRTGLQADLLHQLRYLGHRVKSSHYAYRIGRVRRECSESLAAGMPVLTKVHPIHL